MGLWDYQGKRVAIVGCATGMGEAAAQELVRLGAEVHAADIRPTPAPVASFRTVDMRDPASIDAMAESIGGKLDCLFYCAGLPQTFPALDVMKVNFIGMRHLTERMAPMIKEGGAIASIASTAAMNFMKNMAKIQEFLKTPDFASAVKWCEANADLVDGGYAFSKEAISVWTMLTGAKLIKQRGIRVNCTWPAPTETPMMLEFEKQSPASLINVFAEPSGRRSTPEEQAWPLLFLNSGAAKFVNGHVLPVDGGFMGAVTAGAIDLQKLFGAAMGAPAA